jgi:hypothetical protein
MPTVNTVTVLHAPEDEKKKKKKKKKKKIKG